VNEALESVLGHGGSDMIYRYILQIGVERGEMSSNLGSFRRMLRELLGVGADHLEGRIFRRLYLTLRMFPRGV